MQKQKPIRIKKIRESARGQDCTIRSPWCNQDPETVVFAHYGAPDEKGMGLKPGDHSGAYACSSCHDWLDGRPQQPMAEISIPFAREQEWYWFRGMRRTWRLLIENGVLS